MGVTSFRGDLKFLAHDDDRGLQSVQLYDLGVSGSAAEIFLSNVPQGIALFNGVSDPVEREIQGLRSPAKDLHRRLPDEKKEGQ